MSRHGPTTERLPRRGLGPAQAIAVACVAVTCTAATAAAPSGAGGMFVWGAALEMTDGVDAGDGRPTDEALRDELLRTCRSARFPIDRLYFLIDPDVTDRASLADLLTRAERDGIAVYALTPGSLQTAWARPMRRNGVGAPDVVTSWMRRAWSLGTVGGRPLLAGFQLDIEPHAVRTSRWRGRLWTYDRPGRRERRLNAALARGFVDLLDAARATVRELPGTPKIAACVAPWLDRIEPGLSMSLRIGDVEGSLARHVQDRVAWVSVMAYSRARSGPERDGVVEAVAHELAYGPVEVVIETAKPKRRHARRRDTVYRGGMRRLERLVDRLETAYGDRPTYLGWALHHYRDAYGSGSRRWPSVP